MRRRWARSSRCAAIVSFVVLATSRRRAVFSFESGVAPRRAFATTSSRRVASVDDHDAVRVVAAGLDARESSIATEAVARACAALGVRPETTTTTTTTTPRGVPGATGRVVSLRRRTDDHDDGRAAALEAAASEHVDRVVNHHHHGTTDPSALVQPVLVRATTTDRLDELVREEVERHDLRRPLRDHDDDDVDERRSSSTSSSFVPDLHVEIDGAMVADPRTGEERWDTSDVFVFDGLVPDDLRRRLLDVVLGRGDDDDENERWDDATRGPDPARWVRGGLDDVFDDDDDDDGTSSSSCWGLREEAIEDLCCNRHDAIVEFERILVDLFPYHVVTRLPEAVLGACFSPLTANAPTSTDTFSYHIDADPNLTPPSPWTDVFGRYPNRVDGKPRFVSCLVYLNDAWDGATLGAPTRFLDPPTGETYEVLPRPGRVVVLDQDVTHTVVAPSPRAGPRPRYSLVWKLVLHPRAEGQPTRRLFRGTATDADASPARRRVRVGSAARDDERARASGRNQDRATNPRSHRTPTQHETSV